MADETKAGLRNRVLRHVGRLEVGDVAEDAEADIVEATLVAFYNEMNLIGHGAGWSDTSIPQEIVIPVRDIVAADCAGELQLEDQQQAVLLAAKPEAERRFFAQQSVTADINEPLATDYY